MTETDFLNQILASNPNEPATKGVVLLLRTETQSEFRTVRDEIGQWHREMNEGFGKVDEQFKEIRGELHEIRNSVDLIAQQVAFLVQKAK